MARRERGEGAEKDMYTNNSSYAYRAKMVVVLTYQHGYLCCMFLLV